METTISLHRNREISIIISVVLHVCILIFIFLHRYTKFEIEKFKTKSSEAEIVMLPEEQWATRLAQSNPSLPALATVDTIETTETSNLSPTDVPATDTTENTTETINHMQTDIPATNISTETTETPIHMPFTETLNQPQTDTPTAEIVNAIQKTTNTQTLPITPSTHTLSQETQKPLPITKPISQTIVQQNTKPISQQKTQSTLQAKKIQARKDLAKLAQSFMNYGCDASGDSKLSIRGNYDGPATAEQLKKERYLERITGCLHQSMRIHSHMYPHKNQDFPTNPRISLTIANNGFLQEIELLTSSRDKQIDNYFMAVFKDAGNSFPPVPSYLGKQPFSITYEIVSAMDNAYSVNRIG